jgi:hypothetical protein
MAENNDFPLIGGLPDAPVIGWIDSEHEPQFASRYGHPGNKVWKLNGYRYEAEDLLKIIGSGKVAPLDFRFYPQTAPSEYMR